MEGSAKYTLVRLSVDYPLLASKVLIVRYALSRAFVYHTTRCQGASGVEIMRVLWDVNL